MLIINAKGTKLKESKNHIGGLEFLVRGLLNARNQPSS